MYVYLVTFVNYSYLFDLSISFCLLIGALLRYTAIGSAANNLCGKITWAGWNKQVHVANRACG